jgi:anti-sigma factor RsiW
MAEATITEDELHAYADGVLPADRIDAVESYLAANPAEATRIADWREQAAQIRARFGSVADEPVPERLRLENILLRASGLRRKVAAAAAIALIIGASGGWFAHDYFGAADTSEIALAPAGPAPETRYLARALADAAIEAHRLYINEVRHPIEVRADEAHLLPWLSRRVGSQVRAPVLDAEGLKLLGGRLLPGSKGPAALIMYEGQGGERITITSVRAGTDQDSAFKWRQAGDVGALAWIESGLAFVVAGPAERDRLDRIARRVHAAYETIPAAGK